MFKKWLILLPLLLSSPAMAAFYIGGGVGLQNTGPYNGLFVNAFGGYGRLMGKNQLLYLGGELFGDSGSLPLSQNYYERSNYGLGASFMPGLQINPTTLLYFRIGVETFRLSNYLNYKTGGQLGLGVQTNLTEKFDLRAEFVYTGQGVYHNFGISQYRIFRLGLVYSFT
jgi:opacity protein-like surface antigen